MRGGAAVRRGVVLAVMLPVQAEWATLNSQFCTAMLVPSQSEWPNLVELERIYLLCCMWLLIDTLSRY